MASEAGRLPPVWVRGLGFLPLGVFVSLMLLTTPTLLASNHTPEPTIALVTAAGLASSWVAIPFMPILDWRYSRRTYAILFTLVGAGFLFRLPDSERFVLTSSVLELSNGFLRNFDIRARARPFLIELAERTALSVHLAVRDRLDMVVIDAIRPRSAVLVSRLEIGSRMNLSRTAVGRGGGICR